MRYNGGKGQGLGELMSQNASGEFLVNTISADRQENATITGLANGGFVVSWQDFSQTLGDASGTSIKAKIFDANGVMVVDEFLVNTQTATFQLTPTITGLENGGFVVAWEDSSATLGDADYTSIKAKIFGATGSVVVDEFLVNSQTALTQTAPSVTSLSNGNFVVSWDDQSRTLGDDSSFSVKAKIFTAAGSLVKNEFLVNTETFAAQSYSTISGLENGGFVVSWSDPSQTLGDTSGSAIKAKTFDAAGTVVQDEFLVNTQTFGQQDLPSVTGLQNGGYVITWTDGSGTLGDASNYSIKAKVFGASGVVVQDEFLVNTQTASFQRFPAIVGLENGGFAITWQDASKTLGDSAGTSIKLKLFDATGSVVADELLVNSETGYDQTNPAIAALADGGFVVSWDDKSGTLEADGYGVGGYDTSTKAQIFDAAGVKIGPLVSEGTLFNDVLLGTDRDNVIFGLHGNDSISGLGGDDTLYGGEGRDTLVGGTGDDFLFGGTDETDLRDVLYGGDGNDMLDGGYGNDELRGDAGNDTIMGGFGADTVIGGTGDDVLTGGAFGDALTGSDGDDFLNGGFGFDRLNGGAGADRFYHLGIADHGSDWIQDYNAAEGDVLMFGGAASTAASDFLIQRAFTPNAGVAGVAEVFVTQISTGNLLWALVDGAAQESINVSIGGQVFDLLS